MCENLSDGSIDAADRRGIQGKTETAAEKESRDISAGTAVWIKENKHGNGNLFCSRSGYVTWNHAHNPETVDGGWTSDEQSDVFYEHDDYVILPASFVFEKVQFKSHESSSSSGCSYGCFWHVDHIRAVEYKLYVSAGGNQHYAEFSVSDYRLCNHGNGVQNGFSKLQIAAIIVSIGGMVFLTGAGGNLSVFGMILAILSAFTYGIYLVANEKGPVNDLPIEVKLFYVSLPATVYFAVMAPVTNTLCAPAGGITGWLLLIGGSGMFMVGGYFLMMAGISKMGASNAAFVSMLEPIVSVIFGTLWFKDPVTYGIVIGGTLVISSILLIAVDGYRKEKSEEGV